MSNILKIFLLVGEPCERHPLLDVDIVQVPVWKPVERLNGYWMVLIRGTLMKPHLSSIMVVKTSECCDLMPSDVGKAFLKELIYQVWWDVVKVRLREDVSTIHYYRTKCLAKSPYLKALNYICIKYDKTENSCLSKVTFLISEATQYNKNQRL